MGTIGSQILLTSAHQVRALVSLNFKSVNFDTLRFQTEILLTKGGLGRTQNLTSRYNRQLSPGKNLTVVYSVRWFIV